MLLTDVTFKEYTLQRFSIAHRNTNESPETHGFAVAYVKNSCINIII